MAEPITTFLIRVPLTGDSSAFVVVGRDAIAWRTEATVEPDLQYNPQTDDGSAVVEKYRTMFPDKRSRFPLTNLFEFIDRKVAQTNGTYKH